MAFHIIIVPLLALIIAQFSKLFIKSNNIPFSFKNIFAYSGMPSGHSALVSSLAMTTGLEEGWHSAAFAISLILAIVVMRDATGIRRYLGQHGKILNILVKDLRDDNVLEEEYPRLLEKVGHSPAQVAVGALIGIIISLAVFYIL